LEDKYTGQVTVSQYHVAYITPKEFPPRYRSDNEEEAYLSRINPTASVRRRRASISEKNVLQFVAAIDLWVPFVSKPPRAPYLVCDVIKLIPHFSSLYPLLAFYSYTTLLAQQHQASNLSTRAAKHLLLICFFIISGRGQWECMGFNV
jgi:hypothetical protein